MRPGALVASAWRYSNEILKQYGNSNLRYPFNQARNISICRRPELGNAIEARSYSWFAFNFLNRTEPQDEMNKRAAPSGAAAPTPSKKRKTDNVQKFYAVKAGFRPGVYLTYGECSAQTAGFKGAVCKSMGVIDTSLPLLASTACNCRSTRLTRFPWNAVKSFTSQEDAEAFVAGKKVMSASTEPDRFYAVAVGNPTGIYTDWNEAAVAIKGVKGPKYKRFGSRVEAVAYIRQFGSKEAIEALGEPIPPPPAAPVKPSTASADPKKPDKSANTRTDAVLRLTEDILQIYTDGSSLANGKVGSRAGVGVYFGDADSRNVSERLAGEPQTNQRAELMAMLRALEIAPVKQTVQIISDSQYSINCVTQWAIGWKQKGWLTATGQQVKNQDIIRSVLDRMEARTKAKANTYFRWVKGHASDRGNQAADRLAVRGAKLP